jgi:hypothetical protein
VSPELSAIVVSFAMNYHALGDLFRKIISVVLLSCGEAVYELSGTLAPWVSTQSGFSVVSRFIGFPSD